MILSPNGIEYIDEKFKEIPLRLYSDEEYLKEITPKIKENTGILTKSGSLKEISKILPFRVPPEFNSIIFVSRFFRETLGLNEPIMFETKVLLHATFPMVRTDHLLNHTEWIQ